MPNRGKNGGTHYSCTGKRRQMITKLSVQEQKEMARKRRVYNQYCPTTPDYNIGSDLWGVGYRFKV